MSILLQLLYFLQKNHDLIFRFVCKKRKPLQYGALFLRENQYFMFRLQ